ncbi:MAG: YcxB family protein [Anaerolineae bacterium]|nr:YcxB family protein [Anaerolineae bacterium]MBT7191416.1 YcxB family protein [Anaerolineae bacterium]MBT7992024.1 YcxB family protein [Anaerolineae bacterium]
MQIKFNGKYDKKLFFNAVRLANEPGRTSRMMYILVGMVFGVVTVTTINEIIQTGDLAGSIIEIALILLMGLVLYQAYVPSYLGARKMWTAELEQRIMSGKISKDGITYNFPQGDKSYLWSDFNRLRKTPHLVTLITLGGMLLIFPRYFFKTDADWERFTNLVSTRVISTKRK